MSNSQRRGVITIRTISIVCAIGRTADQRQRLAVFEAMDKERMGPPGSIAAGGPRP